MEIRNWNLSTIGQSAILEFEIEAIPFGTAFVYHKSV